MRFADGPSFSSGRSETRADGPPGLRGRSVFLGSVLVVLLSLTDGPWLLSGIHPGYSCKEGRIVEDGLLVEFPCTPTRTRFVYSY
jgi:hypothetical protein